MAIFKIDIINYKTKGVIEKYSFVPSMSNKSSNASNINVFKYSNIWQLGLDKNNPYYNEPPTFYTRYLKI